MEWQFYNNATSKMILVGAMRYSVLVSERNGF